MKKLLFITNILMAVILSRFAISKLAGWEISVQAFIEMAKPLGIDPTFFRIATGILITIVVIGYFLTAMFSLLNKVIRNNATVPFTKWATYTNILGFLTMMGALIAEFSLRVQPKSLLVYIAIGIVLVSIANILIIKKAIKTES
ncbi:hypothetical protein ITJ86_05835 [Winogradskyella sp. F6397]|uniref:Uncharacterized protein n=1 Tax=Winogradskyella marina TaxID=2785530 RepID=A0ABS0EG25_9FLAO|nr:hypothetical protein [Winogradskyella marina]MBF8149408.1 hypothetical protein [Winogradskyella marina]